MDNVVDIMYESKDSLTHHGVLGQKWGLRRYQNKDGSLTSAGKKRLQKLNEEREKLTGDKNDSSSTSSSTPVRKIVSDMTDEELRTKINRLQMEQQYTNLVKSLTPVTEKKSSKFVERYLEPAAKKIIWDTAVDIGAKAVTQMLANTVNKNSKNIKINTNANAQKKQDEKKK